jgi:hypothetical protein
MRLARLAVPLGVLGLVLGAFAACSSSSMPGLPPNENPDGSPVHSDGGEAAARDHHADHAVAADAGTDKGTTDSPITEFDGAGLCADLTQIGGQVEVLAQPAPAPSPAGGPTPASGTYVLTRVYSYIEGPDASGGTGALEQATLKIGAGVYGWAFAEGSLDGGLGATSKTGGTYTVSPDHLVLRELCPSSEAPDAGTSVPYTAMGTALWIFKGSSIVEVYSPM